MLKIHCSCGKRISFPAEYAGKTGRCPRCQESVRIPLPAPVASAELSLPEPEKSIPWAPIGAAATALLLLAGLAGWWLTRPAKVDKVPEKQVAAAPAQTARPEPNGGRTIRYSRNSSGRDGSQPAEPEPRDPDPDPEPDPDPGPDPPRSQPTRPKPVPKTRQPKPRPRPAKPKPRPATRPRPVRPKAPPLPRRFRFSAAEAARAVGKRLTLKMVGGATISGVVVKLEGDRLMINRGGAVVGVSWDKIDFASRYALKAQVIEKNSASDYFQLALHALAAKRGLLARDALANATGLDREGTRKKFAPYRKLLYNQLRELSAPALLRGKRYLKQKNLLHALGQFKDARRIHDGPEANNAIGEVYYFQRKIKQAMAHFDRALEIKPDYLPGMLNRGFVNFFVQKYQQARADFQRVLKIQPTHKTAGRYLTIVEKVLAGPGWAKGYDVKSAHYFLSTDHSMAYARKMTAELEAIYKAYDKQFRAEKKRNARLRFRVIIFKTRQLYAKYTEGVTGSHFAATRTAGFYSSTLKQLVLWDNRTVIKTLYHEGFHQFLDYFLENPPRWFNEGLAEVFETAKKLPNGSFKFFLVNRKDLGPVKRLIRNKQAYSIDQLLNLPVADFYKNAKKTYPLSWSLCYFLIHGDKGAYRRMMTRFFRSLLKGESPQAAYKKAFGRVDMAALDKRWKAYILQLK